MAVVLDLYSRRVVGWSMQPTMTAQLVMAALLMAILRRGGPEAVLHHSDQGSQYTSEDFQRLLESHGVTCSMSRRGNCWDNAAMESFFSTLKTERSDGGDGRVAGDGVGVADRLRRRLRTPAVRRLRAAGGWSARRDPAGGQDRALLPVRIRRIPRAEGRRTGALVAGGTGCERDRQRDRAALPAAATRRRSVRHDRGPRRRCFRCLAGLPSAPSYDMMEI